MDQYVITPRILQGARLVPVLLREYFLIPAGTGVFQLNLTEVPVDHLIAPPSVRDTMVIREVLAADHTKLVSGTAYNEVSSTSPDSTQYHLDATTWSQGAIYLSHADAGKTLEIVYYGQGSVILVSDINTIGGGGGGGIGSALPLSGGTMTGPIDMQLNNIIWKSPTGARYKISMTDDGVIDISPV